MAQSTDAAVAEGTDNDIPQPKPDVMSAGVNGLVNAISSVFAGIATESLSSDGKLNISQLPILLERTASMLRDINQAQDQVIEDNTQNVVPVVQAEPETGSSVLFEDEWKLEVSKSTGKILGIFPDNALAQWYYSDGAEEEIASRNALSNYNSAVERCRKHVTEIIKECRRTNRKYRDPDFDLEDKHTCLFPMDDSHDYGTLPQGHAQTRKIFKKPQFYVNDATASDVKQGQAGDCWFLAGIAALTNFKACLKQNYVKVDDDEKVGVYGFVFHRDGEWIYEIVDDFLYTKNPRYGHLTKLALEPGENPLTWRMLRSMPEEKYSATFSEGGDALYFAQSRDENETWLPLMEKAFAKAHGDYWAIDGGHTGEAIEDLTGGITTELRTEDILDPDKLWEEILLCNEQFIFGCWTPQWPDASESKSQGLYSGHAYSIMKAVDIYIEGKPERLVLVRNPWGQSEWTGRYSDGSREMTVSLLHMLGHETGDDGMFYMSFEDFLDKFEFIDRIRLIGNDWSCAQCWINVKVPRTNDFLTTKYVFTMDRADYVVMSLSQLDDRYIRGLLGQYTFTLEFRVEKDGASQVVAESTRGINTLRSVNTEIHLEAGKYNVLLKINAGYDPDAKTVKDTVKHYVSTNKKKKLIQLAKKYNSAHMKPGVGDKEDRIFESLSVQEADQQEDPKPKSDSDEQNPGDNPTPPITDGGNQGSSSDGPATDPATDPATEPTKPAPTKTDKPEEKKDKSIENWNPVATIGLRLFTRKAKVALSVVQEVVDVSKLTGQISEDGNTNTVIVTKPTILISDKSKGIGDVPPIGEPLPVTPKPRGSDSGAVDAASLASATIEDTSKAFIILDSHGLKKLSSVTSVPVSMGNVGVHEGAEKAESTKPTTEQSIKLKSKTDGNRPIIKMVHETEVVPETLNEFKLPWAWSPEPGYIYILCDIDQNDYDNLVERSRKFRETRKTSITRPHSNLTVQTSLLSPNSNTTPSKQLQPAPQPASRNNKPETIPKPAPGSDHTDSTTQQDIIITPNSSNNSTQEIEPLEGTTAVLTVADITTSSPEMLPVQDEIVIESDSKLDDKSDDKSGSNELANAADIVEVVNPDASESADPGKDDETKASA